MLLSIIIPTLNEYRRLPRCIARIRTLAAAEGPIEVIVVDGGSSDGTENHAQLADKFVSAAPGKGRQCNAGAGVADGNILFFLHATISVPVGALTAIRQTITDSYVGGGFSNRFAGVNNKTLRLRRVMTLGRRNPDTSDNLTFYGDNGIFVRKDVFNTLGGFPEIEIMEDYEFSRSLRLRYPVKRILEPRLTVSPRRQLKSGFLKTRLQWVTIHSLYNLGISPKRLKKLYSDVR